MAKSIKLDEDIFLDGSSIILGNGSRERLDNFSRRFNTQYYDANTSRTDTSARASAIIAAINAIGSGKHSKIGLSAFGIRYAGGYYFSYIAVNTSDGAATMSILEINPYTGQLCIWNTENGTGVSLMRTI